MTRLGLTNLLLIIFLLTSPARAAWGTLVRPDSDPLSGGERSNQDEYYKRLIDVHATFASFTFLLLVPCAIIIARYLKNRNGFGNGRWLYVHMGGNILAVIFLLVVFLTGYYAVGKGNVFDNPHHRIGLTIIAAVWLQATLGLLNAFVFSKPHIRTPIQNKLHIVLGWLTWGLAIANIAVGMVLYGSPIYDFVLFAIAGGFWMIAFIVLEALIGRQVNNVAKEYKQIVNWNGQVVGEKGEEI